MEAGFAVRRVWSVFDVSSTREIAESPEGNNKMIRTWTIPDLRILLILSKIDCL
jgi:hypothetical protein